MRETSRKTRIEAKKTTHMASAEANSDGDGMLVEENVATAIAQSFTEKLNALMEQKFAEPQSTLDKMGNRIEDNVKRITEAESCISEGEDRTTSLENRVAELEQRVKSLTD